MKKRHPLIKKKGENDTNVSFSHVKEKPKVQMESKSLGKGQSDQALSAEVTSEHSPDQEAKKETEISLNMVQKTRGNWVNLKIIRHLVNSILKENRNIHLSE